MYDDSTAVVVHTSEHRKSSRSENAPVLLNSHFLVSANLVEVRSNSEGPLRPIPIQHRSRLPRLRVHVIVDTAGFSSRISTAACLRAKTPEDSS